MSDRGRSRIIDYRRVLGMNNVVVGKRIKFGQIVLGCLQIVSYIWEVDANVILTASMVITGLGQIWIANNMPITTK